MHEICSEVTISAFSIPLTIINIKQNQKKVWKINDQEKNNWRVKYVMLKKKLSQYLGVSKKEILIYK